MALGRLTLTILSFLLYSAFPTKNYYWDGISFAQAIEDVQHLPELLHPNHLLYNFIGYAAYVVLGERIRALYLLQSLSIVAASMTVYLVYGIVERVSRSSRTAFALTAMFAFSGTWWRFSSDANAYILSTLLLTACAYVLLCGTPRATTVAVLHSAAMLIHQLAILFTPAVAISLLYLKGRKQSLPYLTITGALTAGCYLAAFMSVHEKFDMAVFWAWINSHAQDAQFSFGLSNVRITLRSWLQLLVAGRPSLVRFYDWDTIILLILLVVLLVLFVRRLVQGRHLPRIRVHNPDVFRFALLWLLPFAAFLFVWLPHNTFYKIFALPALVLLIAACWRPERPFTTTASLFVGILALWNLTFAIIPYSRESANGAIEFALKLRPELDRNAIVYYDSFTTDNWFVRYFSPRSTWRRLEDDAALIDSDLNTGKAVWLDTTAFDRMQQVKSPWMEAERRELINSKHRIRFVRLRSIEVRE